MVLRPTFGKIHRVQTTSIPDCGCAVGGPTKATGARASVSAGAGWVDSSSMAGRVVSAEKKTSADYFDSLTPGGSLKVRLMVIRLLKWNW